MSEIKSRMDVVRRVLDSKGREGSLTGYRESDIELCFLQIRKCLELIMYSSTVAHYHAGVDLQRRIISGEWNASRILSYIERVNPNSFPIPLDRKPSGEGEPDEMVDVSGALTKDEFRKLYDRLCGSYLHASRASAFQGKHDDLFRDIESSYGKLVRLLNHHWIKFTDVDVLAVVMQTKDGDVQVVHLQQVGPLDAKRATDK